MQRAQARPAATSPIQPIPQNRQSNPAFHQGRSTPDSSFLGRDLNYTLGSAAADGQSMSSHANPTTLSAIALQQLYILDVNAVGIIDSKSAQEFYEHSQRWSQNYTVAQVITIKAQRCIADQIYIDQNYAFPEQTRYNWNLSLTVPQVGAPLFPR
jgi:hypothetical protein